LQASSATPTPLPRGTAVGANPIMTSPRPEIGARIRSARQQQRLSLNDVATRSGISAATLSRVETARQSIDVDLLMALAGVLGVPPATLIGGSEHPVGHDRMRPAAGRARKADLPAIIDNLVSRLDMIRDELEHVVQATRPRRKA
jgi:transcriptional regulator with XRE-family HTH domain